MATTTSNSGTEATRRNTTASTTDEGLGGTARQVAENVAGAAGEVTARIPEVTSATRDAWSEANRMVHAGSDETLKLVGATSIGFAVGLLVGGANPPGAGLGLVGLGERAKLAGGEVSTRRDAGAFELTGWLPWTT